MCSDSSLHLKLHASFACMCVVKKCEVFIDLQAVIFFQLKLYLFFRVLNYSGVRIKSSLFI